MPVEGNSGETLAERQLPAIVKGGRYQATRSYPPAISQRHHVKRAHDTKTLQRSSQLSPAFEKPFWLNS
jgi:hypothetical protein